MRATPIGTAIGRLKGCGRAFRAAVETAATARSGRRPPRQDTGPEQCDAEEQATNQVCEASDHEEGLHSADAVGRRVTEGSDDDVVHIAGPRSAPCRGGRTRR